MVSRYFILSGIPMTQITICNEIQNMISYLVENLKPSTSKTIQSLTNGVENLNFPDLSIFEFITKKQGRRGPSKTRCIEYYSQKLVSCQLFDLNSYFIISRNAWITNSLFFDVLKEGFQTLTIPKSGTYSFEVIGAGNDNERSGARIIGKIRLERGEKITVALGQQGKGGWISASGATFVVKETGNGPEPLFVAAGAGYSDDNNYGRASLAQTANGNEKIGSSGVQKFPNGEEEDFYCSGAGFLETPKVGRLNDKSEPPQSYSQGLMGGKGYSYDGNHELEGGFGGGGAKFDRKLNGKLKFYEGCGGGYTGGSSRIRNDQNCDGGGGGSYAADSNATFGHKFEKFGKCKIEFLN